MVIGHNLFLGLQPGNAARDAILFHQTCLRAKDRHAVKLVPDACLHMSLLRIGLFESFPGRVVDHAIAAAATVTMLSFVIGLNRIVPWRAGEGRSTLVLTGDESVIGAELLYERMRLAFAEPGRLRGRPFNPHVTLMRGASPRPDEFVEMIRWRVSEFVLIHSLVGERRHEVLGRWPLHTVH